ncbi:MAG TPA: stage II sporulation protein M [Thermoanaerobacterales bacterium]|nr:stage II sporulation protein M [Thermoanaerobacterales bacterium]
MNYFPRIIFDYFKKNMGLYVFVFLIFVGGTICGSIAVNMMSDNQLKATLDFINGFFANIKNIEMDFSTVFYESISNNLKTALILCILGLTIIGLPLIPAMIFFRGFVLGFTVGFFIGNLGIKGILFSILSILPQNIIIIPSIISIGVAGMTLSLTVMKNRFRHYTEDYPQLLMGYFLLNFTFCVMLILAGLIEGYISPVFIKLLTNYI